MNPIAEKEADLQAAREHLASLATNPGTSSLRGKQHGIRIDAAIQRTARLVETIRRLERELEGLHRAESERADPAFVAGPNTIRVGDFVATRLTGWREVVRVNKKSVSVATGYSWTDTVLYVKILRHRGGPQ